MPDVERRHPEAPRGYPPEGHPEGDPEGARLLEALRDVEDPELPLSIVDLGLVVDLACAGGRVAVQITFTAMGCPGTEMIIEDIRERLLREPGVEEVEVEVVWEPIWTKDRLSEDGRMAMREYGIAL